MLCFTTRSYIAGILLAPNRLPGEQIGLRALDLLLYSVVQDDYGVCSLMAILSISRARVLMKSVHSSKATNDPRGKQIHSIRANDTGLIC